jgi:hypothetical protein
LILIFHYCPDFYKINTEFWDVFEEKTLNLYYDSYNWSITTNNWLLGGEYNVLAEIKNLFSFLNESFISIDQSGKGLFAAFL